MSDTGLRRTRTHDGTSSVERQIFTATERLLAGISARNLSVSKILAEAGVSRGSFYHYFDSKWDVVNALARVVLDAIFARLHQFVVPTSEDPRGALRVSVAAGCEAFAEHRAVIRAITEHWREVPELRAGWLEIMGRFTDAIALTIDRERALGRIPAGADSRQLATVLLWASADTLYLAGLGEIDGLQSESDVVIPMTALWMGTLYGSPDDLPPDAAGVLS